MPCQLPASAAFALWFTAWRRGAASLDHARDGVVGADAAHHVTSLPGEVEPIPLIVAFGRLRATGATSAGIALPVAGDPLGLAGPPAFNGDALEAAEGVVLDGADLGLVPHRAGAGVTWTCQHAVSRRQVPDLPEADTALRRAVLAAADTIAELDVAAWPSEDADAVLELEQPSALPLPPGMTPRAVRLASLSLRCRAIVGLALRDDGAAVTAAEADRRRQALLPLDRAARRGLVAACSSPFGR